MQITASSKDNPLGLTVLFLIAGIIKDAFTENHCDYRQLINNIVYRINQLEGFGMINDLEWCYNFPGFYFGNYFTVYWGHEEQTGGGFSREPEVFFYAGEPLDNPWENKCWTKIIVGTESIIPNNEQMEDEK